jgi:hypothetical protein
MVFKESGTRRSRNKRQPRRTKFGSCGIHGRRRRYLLLRSSFFIAFIGFKESPAHRRQACSLSQPWMASTATPALAPLRAEPSLATYSCLGSSIACNRLLGLPLMREAQDRTTRIPRFGGSKVNSWGRAASWHKTCPPKLPSPMRTSAVPNPTLAGGSTAL